MVDPFEGCCCVAAAATEASLEGDVFFEVDGDVEVESRFLAVEVDGLGDKVVGDG